MINGLVSGLMPSGGGLGAADKSAALADIALERRKVKFQQTTGLRDIGQERQMGLKAAINNALQRGVYDSGIRTGNQQLVNRESNEAVADLKQQISFALEALKNREKAVKAGGSGGGGGGGIGFGSALEIISRIMGMGGSYGWNFPSPWANPESRGAPGYGGSFGKKEPF
jgi:hypothetical protein